MMESTFNSSMIYYIMGAVTIGGMISKLVVSVALKKLVQAASDMSKSTHKFMKLVRAKFEHACMVNDRVDNIDVFVDKYIQEYQVWGIHLHGWQRLERICIIVLAIATLLGCGNAYYYQGLGELMLQQALLGIVLSILLLGIYQLVDEKFRIQSAKVYMVDYLENVCAHRCVRNSLAKDKPINLVDAVNMERDIKEHDFAEKLEEQMVNIELKQRLQKNKLENEDSITKQIAQHMAQNQSEEKKVKQDEYMVNEATIREILQEFMA